MERLGFEKNRRIVKQYNNIREVCEIGGKRCHFRSRLEKRVAEYLELLKVSGIIKDWDYEFMNFKFPDDSWLIDFTVRENDNEIYHLEVKGHFEARDRKKLKLLFKYFPQARVLYVMQSRKDIAKMGLATKYLWWREPITVGELGRGLI